MWTWKAWICKWLRIPLVVLEDFDGERVLRIKRDNHGRAWAKRMGMNIRNVTLAPDGTCPDGYYVYRWWDYTEGDVR